VMLKLEIFALSLSLSLIHPTHTHTHMYRFANRAKNIKNKPRINEDLDQRSLLRKYERELKRLRDELDSKSQSVVSKRRLLEMDQQRRQAEQDKMAAIRALEARSVEMMREKAEKRKLERRISMLRSQMLGNFENIKDLKDTPAFRNAQNKIRHKYEAKMAELEKERENIEEEKAQVDRYKQLLLKQRDIMIALTQRLNERDEQIVALQDELDAYDRHQKALEEKLDEKTVELIHVQRVAMEGDHSNDVEEKKCSSTSSLAVVETKQYEPHLTTATIVHHGDNTTATRKLSADEKILELTRVIEQQKNEIEKSQSVLEEVCRVYVEALFLFLTGSHLLYTHLLILPQQHRYKQKKYPWNFFSEKDWKNLFNLRLSLACFTKVRKMRMVRRKLQHRRNLHN
jgi:hypothetical protein